MLPLRRPQPYPIADGGRIVVWGLMASLPFGGMVWQVLHYLVGLRRLGFDVWYVEDTDRVVYEPRRLWPTLDYAPNVERLDAFMTSVGLGDRWVFRPPLSREECLGARDLAGLVRLYAEADAALNLCGAQEIRPEHRSIRGLIYLQTDPTADQVRVAEGRRPKIEELETYRSLFTYGENIGTDQCRVPVEIFEWKTTRPPVILDWWDSSARPAEPRFTTITNWRRFPKKDVRWKGETWSWNKQDEIRKIIALPRVSPVPLELSIGGYVNAKDKALLRDHGWIVRPASRLTDPDVYRAYIEGSSGELTVAKEQYVLPRTGWFSDRSVCYLAAGRPVVTQDTSFDRSIPTGEGLLAFDDQAGALEAIETVLRDYRRHSRAARELAREYFSSDVVLTDMLRKAGLLN
jgi:hypothetical protein